MIPSPVKQDETEKKPVQGIKVKWSGIARSMECSPQGSFNNFRLVTLTIVDGVVVEKKVSDPFASFEAIARMEVELSAAALSLNMNYAEGKTWTK